VSLIPISANVLINPEHISTIDAHQDYQDTAYIVYTITMYNGTAHEIRLRDYWNGPDEKWATLYRAFPKIMERMV
jgi:hypothetical protein